MQKVRKGKKKTILIKKRKEKRDVQFCKRKKRLAMYIQYVVYIICSIAHRLYLLEKIQY